MKQAAAGCTAMHYYRLDRDDLCVVLRILQNILRKRITLNSRRIVVPLSDGEADCLLAFIHECRFGYIHPRSTSARIDFMREHQLSC